MIDIGDAVTEICAALGLDPSSVGRIVIDPASAHITAKVYSVNSDGKLFVNPDTGDAAVEWRHFEVKTG